MSQTKHDLASAPVASFEEALETEIAPAYEYANYDVDCLYEVFNENAKYFRPAMAGLGVRIADFLTNPQTIRRHLAGVKNYDSFPILPLPAAQPLSKIDFIETLNRRRSKPEFSATFSQQQLADLLGNALGSNLEMVPEHAPEQRMHRRPYPSGGGLYPVEFYVLPMRVEGIAPCVTHYNPIKRELRIIRPQFSLEELNNQVLSMPFSAERCPAVLIFLTGVLQRSTNKYGNKGYKLVMIETGTAGQTLQLVTTAMGFNGLLWNSFFDDEAERLLQIDGVTESVITSFLAG